MRAQTPDQHEKEPSAVDGRRLFGSSCAGCHGLDGRGAERGPDLVTNRDVQRLSDSALLRIIREGIPSGGMPPFGAMLDSAQTNAVLEYLRHLEGRSEAAAVSGDPKRGEKLFFGKAKCSDCHMMHGRGGFIGIDLSTYDGSRSAADLRNAILHPDKNLDPRYETVTVVTDDHRTYTGLARNEDNFSLQLQTPDGVFHFFDKSGLARIDRAQRSMMPSDYGKTLSEAEVNDIVAYLLTAGSKGPRPDSGEPER